MSKLPQGWSEATLSEISALGPKSEWDDATEIGFVPMSHAPTNYRDALRYEARPWHEVKKAYTHFENGDVIFAKVTPCFENGKAGLASGLPNGAGAGSSEFHVLRPRPGVAAGYLLAVIKSAQFLREGEENMTGAVGLRRVPRAFVENFPVRLPPAPEQKRITQKLDELLAHVDTLKCRVDAIPALIHRLRAQVVYAAVNGDLTEDFRGGRLPGWRSAKVGDVLREKPRNGYSPKAVRYETSTRSLSLSATTSGKFKGEFCKYIDEKISSGSHLWLQPGDILIQRANTLEYVGVSAIFDGHPNEFIYPDLMMKCRANEKTSPDFLQLVLSSDHVRKYFRDHATGTAGNMPKINQQTVVNAPINLPSIEEQAEIVRRVRLLFAFADQLEAKVASAKHRIDSLTQSLLAKAFHGELVPQDPNDEPASALLERIRAQRANAPKPMRGRAKT